MVQCRTDAALGRCQLAARMLTLYSYPQLYGVADNNGYGLKVFAFLKLTEVPFIHEHIFDASAAPRGQLPYIIDDGDVIGDSETILAHLLHKYRLPIDDQLTNAQRHIHSLVIRMLDDLYWVMSYSRWKDDRFWQAFRDLLKSEHPQLDDQGLEQARQFNDKRYYYQGIGRFTPDAAYARGITDLRILADLIPMGDYAFGPKPTSLDAAIYGFIANIYFLPIETPLKQFVDSHPNLIRHCTAIHQAIGCGSVS
jgi:glutathione S-transferase